MKIGKLRKAGGATVVTIPASLLAEMNLHAGQQVAFRRVGDHIEIVPERQPHYALDDLLAQCDFSQPMGTEESAWLALRDVGHEALE